MQSLEPVDKDYFESICLKTAAKAELKKSLYNLSYFLAQRFRESVFFISLSMTVKANEFFGHGVLPVLLEVIIMKFDHLGVDWIIFTRLAEWTGA